MKPSEIKALFPIILNITKEIVESSIYADKNNCIAATALKTILPKVLWSYIDWGTGIGRIDGVPIRSVVYDANLKKDSIIYIQFATLSDIKEPIEIKFVLDNR